MRALALLCLVLPWLLAAGPAAGQGARPLPGPTLVDPPDFTTEATPDRDRLARLSDAEVRALLLDRLDRDAALAAATPGGLAALRQTLTDAATGLAAAVSGAVARIPNLAGGIAEGVARFWAPRGLTGTLHLLAVALAALLAGHLAERLLRRLLQGFEASIRGARPANLAEGTALIARRLAFELTAAALFLLTAWAVVALAYPPAPISYLILWFFLFVPVLYVRLTAAATRCILAPRTPELRLVALDDAQARFLHRALVAFAALVGLRSYVLSFLGGHGVDLAELRLGFWLTLLIYGWLVLTIWRTRHALTRLLMADGDLSPLEARIARIYPWSAMALVACFWLLTETFTGLGLWHLLDGRLPFTLAVLVFAPVLDTAIRGIARELAPPANDDDPLARTMRRSLVRIGRIIALGLIILVLVEVWDISFTRMETGSFAALVGLHLLEATGVAAIGILVMELVTLAIDRRLATEAPPVSATPAEDHGGEGGAMGGTRLATVLPLVRRFAQIAILALTALAVLSALGVSTTPLLAGAGIVGLAVGFGAQKLVADIVSGLFFLIDDAFRIGEYVEIDQTRGTVEKISVRSLQLRHHQGAVHTIPFGEIPKLTNYSRDWAIMKLRFTIPFDTDLAKVKKIFKTIGNEMMADPLYAPDFMQPFKSQGVYEVDDVGIVIRGKFMARPGRQFVLRKEIYDRVQRAFEQHGIQFARREVRVRIDGASEHQARAAGAAAAETGPAETPTARTGDDR